MSIKSGWTAWLKGARKTLTRQSIGPAGTAGRLVAEPWSLDAVTADEGRVVMSGWAFPDLKLPLPNQAGRFSVNGAPPSSLEYPIRRDGVGQTFWQRSGAENSGFRMVAEARYPAGVMTVRIADSRTETAALARETMWLPDEAMHANLPDADRRFRVIGNRDPLGFLRLGCTDGHRVVAAYEAVTGRKWSHIGALLDWGVGCGRVARHLSPDLGPRFHGCDIDSDNVAWCRENLTGDYRPSKLTPPLPYGNDTFDVIYGISVFTHLRHPWEERWLEELHRVLRPGGSALVTIHGQTAIDFAGLDRTTYALLMERVKQEGLVCTSQNHQLDGFVDSPEEYVNVFHSDEHIQRVWSPYFPKIRQLRGYIFTHDLLVCTKA